MSAFSKFEALLNSLINSEGIDEDGVMDGYPIETYFHLTEAILAKNLTTGDLYVEISFDDGGFNGAVRIPAQKWIDMADKLRTL